MCVPCKKDQQTSMQFVERLVLMPSVRHAGHGPSALPANDGACHGAIAHLTHESIGEAVQVDHGCRNGGLAQQEPLTQDLSVRLRRGRGFRQAHGNTGCGQEFINRETGGLDGGEMPEGRAD